MRTFHGTVPVVRAPGPPGPPGSPVAPVAPAAEEMGVLLGEKWCFHGIYIYIWDSIWDVYYRYYTGYIIDIIWDLPNPIYGMYDIV